MTALRFGLILLIATAGCACIQWATGIGGWHLLALVIGLMLLKVAADA